jgi:hypothetical protein
METSFITNIGLYSFMFSLFDTLVLEICHKLKKLSPTVDTMFEKYVITGKDTKKRKERKEGRNAQIDAHTQFSLRRN